MLFLRVHSDNNNAEEQNHTLISFAISVFKFILESYFRTVIAAANVVGISFYSGVQKYIPYFLSKRIYSMSKNAISQQSKDTFTRPCTMFFEQKHNNEFSHTVTGWLGWRAMIRVGHLVIVCFFQPCYTGQALQQATQWSSSSRPYEACVARLKEANNHQMVNPCYDDRACVCVSTS